MLEKSSSVDHHGHVGDSVASAAHSHAPQRGPRQPDVISYDSDDEMVRSTTRRSAFGSRTTKKGHPIYSREDIREQYCITRKELCVFEDGAYQESRLFGCLSTSNLPDQSPCNRNTSFLLSCVQKRKSNDAPNSKRYVI